MSYDDTEKRIQERAYQIWNDEGRPEGRAEEHWERARMIVSVEQMAFLGNPEFGCELQPIDFAAVAAACGGKGFTVTEPKDCAATLKRALATPGLAVIEAVVDPQRSSALPKIRFEHAKHGGSPRSRHAQRLSCFVIHQRIDVKGEIAA